MNYKLIVLFFILSLVYSSILVKNITGQTEEVSEEIKLYVSKKDVDISILMNGSNCVPTPEYCVGNDVNVSTRLANIGNFNLTGMLITRIFNRTNEIYSENWNDVNLSELEVKYYDTIYKILDKDVDYSVIGPETFTTTSNYSFDGKFNQTSCNFIVKKGIGILRRFPGQIVDTIPPGRTKSYPSAIQLWLEDACQDVTATLNTTQGIPGEWVNFSQDRVYLSPTAINSTNISITVPPLTGEGIYDNGTISVYAGNQRVDIGLNITVAMINFILDTTVQEKRVCQGKIVPANINITKILPVEDVNVSMTYQIIDSNLTVYAEENEYSMSLSNVSVQKLSTLTVPSSAREGHYIFLVTLGYNSTLTQDYDTFDVISCPGVTAGEGGGGGIEEPMPGKKTERSITLNLSTDILTVITGNKTSFIASVKNTGMEPVKSIKISIEGIPSEWIKVFPTSTDLNINEIEEYLIIIDVPYNTTTGVYKLKVKATDGIESNTAILTLIIGKNPKEITELLIKELENIRAEAKKSLLIDDCLDVTMMKTLYQDAELAFEKGKEEYEKKNYEGAINWFEYALPIEKKVVSKVDITLKLEIETTNTSKFLIPPFFKPDQQFQLAGTYLEGKNYEKICDPLERLKRFILIGLIFWPSIVILLIILIILIMIFYRRRRGRERTRIMQRVRERLGAPSA